VVVLASCHVTTAIDDTQYGAVQRVRHPEGAIARAPSVALGEAGALRFVEPLDCPSEEIVEAHTTTEIATRPNLATFVVGVVATAAGGVLATRGLADGDALYAIAGGVTTAVGLPLAIGPWLGNRRELRAGPAIAPVHRPGPSEPCGDRPLAARAATLAIRGREVYGAIDRDGVFAVPAFQLVDAYTATPASSLDFTALVDAAGGPRTIAGVLDGGALAARAAAFLARADFDAKVEPLRLVPNVTATPPAVALAGDAIRVSVALRNDGPGDAFALRGAITASHRAIDGRILYIGRLARGASIVRELAIPLSRAAADALRGTPIEISIELRDAHGTAPATPLRFRGVPR